MTQKTKRADLPKWAERKLVVNITKAQADRFYASMEYLRAENPRVKMTDVVGEMIAFYYDQQVSPSTKEGECCELCFHPSMGGYQTHCKNIHCPCHSNKPQDPIATASSREGWEKAKKEEV